MHIALRPNSTADPLSLEEAEYQRLVRRQEGGWSDCADLTEWLAKLHYLRQGHRDGKLNEQQLTEREERLVSTFVRRVMDGRATVGMLAPGLPPER